MYKKVVNLKLIFLSIFLISLLLRLNGLNHPKDYMFDEVYHAFTAKEYLKGSREAWEWWTSPPKGVAFEWTHPPLAKEIMTFSMLINQSTDSWAWRLPGAALGIISIFLVYKLGVVLFGNKYPALLSAFIFSFDGLSFVQSRIGMNDIYLIAFILLCLLFFFKEQYIYSALAFGLALSSKWAAIYLLPVILLLLISKGRFLKISYFLILPLLIYLFTYLPFFILGHDFNQFIQLQQQMFWYHTGLKATHGYASPWWTWPLNLYPVWYYVEYSKDTIANIFAIGNPVIFWSGITAILLTFLEGVKKRSENLLIIIILFLVFWLPWAFSPRIMFLYHFTPSVPFLSLCLGYQLHQGMESKGGKRLTILLLLLIVLGFIAIYPFISAVPLPKSLVNLFFSINLSKNPF